MSEWLSVCCTAPPHPYLEMSGNADIGVIGICSDCKEHTGFEKEADDE